MTTHYVSPVPYIVLMLTIVIFIMLLFHVIHAHGDLLPPVGKWTNCRNLPEVCDVPEMESNSLSDLAVYRFENGTMIVEYVGDSPIEK